MMFMKERSVKGDKRLPMITTKFRIRCGFILQRSGLYSVHLYTLCFYHCQARVDTLYLRGELFLGYWSRVWLKKKAWIARVISLELK
jgi:hypothetical protein